MTEDTEAMSAEDRLLSGQLTLINAVEIDGKPVKHIQLRKPKAGDMRGLKMTNILQMDVSAMITLIPRISTPALTPQQVDQMEVMDFTILCSGVLAFFVGPDQVRALMQ
ncbi:phage tail assembly protein [Pseudaestuariivita sp.]|uniref:phage tail assembly protein n=1 Tax=Pseudaestuariivita sp. TaxID=2211669 RepID=UPI004059E3F6